ncbi:hypothetical protein BDV97DRAFT_29527 [Delphinella strobiligena]|nr:hypothetical protein BDV97DRAFT_29527 [Delphinella strobiligena]
MASLVQTSLSKALRSPKGQMINVSGVVTDVPWPPKQTSSGEWMLTFTITDLDLMEAKTRHNGIKVRIFQKSQLDLPRIKSAGDVVLLRQVKSVTFSNDPVLVGVKGKTGYAVFLGSDIPTSADPTARARAGTLNSACYSPDSKWVPSATEQLDVIMLKGKIPLNCDSGRNERAKTSKPSTQVESSNNPLPLPKPPLVRDKFGLIKEVACNEFYDIFVDVIKIFPGQFDMCEVYVTDYTANSLLFNYPSPDEEDDGMGGRDGDTYGYIGLMPTSKRDWPGPYGSMTLKIEVREPHASFIRNKVKEGDVVLLQNVRIKMSGQNKMEGNMWTDYSFPNKVCVVNQLNEDDIRVEELRQRKHTYWADRKQRDNKKRGASKELSKLKKKKKLKLKAKATSKQKAELQENVSHHNKHIRCRTDVEESSLTNIISADRSVMPFSDRERRALVRVVDFFPPTLEEFSGAVDVPQENEDDPLDDDYATQRWEWAFSLLVERANLFKDPAHQPEQVWLQVDHEAAEFLLDLNATNLTSDQQRLAQLREKLSILWGNLDERKSAAHQEGVSYPSDADPAGETKSISSDARLSNLPFECCIREACLSLNEDVPSEYTSVYNIFGTTIK